MTTPQLPTRGQQRILQFAARANRRLRGHRDEVSDERTYRIIELSQEPPPRDVMPVTPQMVASLQAAGWIEVALGTRTDWEYRVTQAGIAAANGPSRQQWVSHE